MERAYTVKELDALRLVFESRPSRNGPLEDVVRTAMLAGHTAEDIAEVDGWQTGAPPAVGWWFASERYAHDTIGFWCGDGWVGKVTIAGKWRCLLTVEDFKKLEQSSRRSEVKDIRWRHGLVLESVVKKPGEKDGFLFAWTRDGVTP